MASSNLYPPVIDTYMPAFITDFQATNASVCRVYFSLSSYNSIEDINRYAVQVTVTNQNSNVTALNLTSYPSGIMLKQMFEDYDRKSDDKWYINIYGTDIKNGFNINTYYKVQIRFTSNNIITPESQAIDSWLAKNINNFSEWSTVCLIRGISIPKLQLKTFDEDSESITLNTADVDIVGKLFFQNIEENDTLKSYRIKLYYQEHEVIDSGLIYSDQYANTNEINYTLPYNFQDGESYKLEVLWTTRNLYSDSQQFEFTVISEFYERLNVTIKAECDRERGRIGVKIKNRAENEQFIGSLTIRRSSNKSNFTIWEDIKTISFDNPTILNFVWWDNTVEGGLLYKYCVQKRTSLGARGMAVITEGNVLADFEHTYLVSKNRQLNLKLDPVVSSLKVNVMDSKVDTLGGKYPFIKRGGNTYYKAIPISGKISFFMDKYEFNPIINIDEEYLNEVDSINKDFISKEEIFKQYINEYEQYNIENKINPMNDTIYEKFYRDEVIKFLNDGEVKLFRSMEEGNILVRLMDVNFTPVQGLGRYLYSFSAVMYEIDECSIKNYYKYDIQNLYGDYITQASISKNYYGQSQVLTIGPNEKYGDVLEALSEEYNKYSKTGYKSKINKLSYLSVNFDSKPYLIYEGGEGPRPILNNATEEQLKHAVLGYILYINGKPILINPEGIYELAGDSVEIHSISAPISTSFTIEYDMSLEQQEDLSQVIATRTYIRKIGQLNQEILYNQSIFQLLFEKYYLKYSNYIQKITSFSVVEIESEPGVVVYIKESGDKKAEKHIIGPTGVLVFNEQDVQIEDVFFAGIMYKKIDESELEMRDRVRQNQYIDTKIQLDNFDETSDLLYNGVYMIDEEEYLWNGFYFEPIEREGEYVYSKKPVPALINYVCDVMKGEFNNV